MKAATATLLAALALAFGGCGGDAAVTADEADSAFATISGGERPGTEPTIDPPDRPPPEKLLSRDLETGSGPVARLGDEVAIRYLGVAYETGEEAAWGWQYPPFVRFRLRSNGADWENAVLGMRVGGRRELIIPARLAPDTGAIDYLIELVRLEGNASEEADSRFPPVSDGSDPRFATISPGDDGPRDEPEIDPPDRPSPKELLIRDLEVGSGAIARPGDRVALRYLGVIYETGRLYFRGWLYPPALKIQLQPSGQAWEEGIWGMREGGRREVVVPSRLAFGNGAIDYLIELVRVEPAAETQSG